MLTRMLERIIRGCGYLEGFGEHPGTPFLITLIMIGGLAGLLRGSLVIGLIGAGTMLVVFGPMYLYGAWDRARLFDREKASQKT